MHSYTPWKLNHTQHHKTKTASSCQHFPAQGIERKRRLVHIDRGRRPCIELSFVVGVVQAKEDTMLQDLINLMI